MELTGDQKVKIRSIIAEIEDQGVSTYFLVMRDPDTDQILISSDGDKLWIAGAARYAERETLMDFGEE